MNFETSPDLYYSANFEWAQVDENLVTFGVTDYRLHQLGEILYLELPEEGKTVHQGEVFCSMESLNETHDFIAPVSGTVVEVNRALEEDPSVINDDAFEQGWIVKIEMDNVKDLTTLMRAKEYRKLIGLAPLTEPTKEAEPEADFADDGDADDDGDDID